MSATRFAGVFGGALAFLIWTLGLIVLIEAASPRAHIGSAWCGALLSIGALVVGGLIGSAATR